MALQLARDRWTAASGLARALLLVVVMVALMLVLTLVFGMHVAGPSYDIVPDPAGVGLPF